MDDSDDDRFDAPPTHIALTPNQIVAYNLRAARDWKGWTQRETVEALEPYLGAKWTTANYSLAERSVDGRQIRNFDADDIIAFARTFELPVTWFFMPPPPFAEPGVPTKLQTPDADRWGLPLALLVDLVFGEDWHIGLLSVRLEAFLQEHGTSPLSDAQQKLTALVEERKTHIVRHAVRDLQQWQTSLRALANQLEDLEARSAHLDNDGQPED